MNRNEMSKEDYNAFLAHCEVMCEKRGKAAVKYLKEKAGNSFIKKFFYLGKYDFKKRKFEKEKNYWRDSLYDKIKWRKFKKYIRKIEMKGVIIKRPYMDKPITYRIYGSDKWENHYRKYCSSWWKQTFENFFDLFKYRYKICSFDYYDIFNNLIVNLTVKGMYLGLYGNATIHKVQMHEIWEARERLIKTYNYDNIVEMHTIRDVKNKYNVDWKLISYDKKKYIDEGKIIEPEDRGFHYGLDPREVVRTMLLPLTGPAYRKMVCEKIKEIEDYYYSQNSKYEKELLVSSKEYFGYIGENIYGWWD